MCYGSEFSVTAVISFLHATASCTLAALGAKRSSLAAEANVEIYAQSKVRTVSALKNICGALEEAESAELPSNDEDSCGDDGNCDASVVPD